MTSSSSSIVIAAAKRTPIGAFQGRLSPLAAPELGGIALRAVLEKASMMMDHIDEVIMGCVLPAGAGQAPARQASHVGGLDRSVPSVTLNKVCGSGLKSVMMAYDMIRAQSATTVLAGGMESMSQAPYLLPNARNGYRFGHGDILDHIMVDGLQDAYQNCAMGVFADNTAEKIEASREAQDAYAIQSFKRAQKAQKEGFFRDEIISVTYPQRKETVTVHEDEQPTKFREDKVPMLKPAFTKNGTVTAGNASSLNDGAAALLITTEDMAHAKGLKPLARIVAHASHARDPEWFTLAPVGAIEKVLSKAGWSSKDVDLYEINEAFAVVALAAIQGLALDPEKVNIHGGACALGHPIGASGARILVTLVHALQHHGLKKGVASLCIGGGEGVAMAIECL